ncbi:hypothetical protein BC629DRAFT_1563561, partial [Irpex lacteus]
MSGAFDRTPVIVDRFCSRDSKSVLSKGRLDVFKSIFTWCGGLKSMETNSSGWPGKSETH